MTPNKKILRMKAACQKLGIGRTTAYTLLNAGDLPPPIRLGSRSIGFFEHELDEWLDARANQRK